MAVRDDIDSTVIWSSTTVFTAKIRESKSDLIPGHEPTGNYQPQSWGGVQQKKEIFLWYQPVPVPREQHGLTDIGKTKHGHYKPLCTKSPSSVGWHPVPEGI